MSKFVSVSLSAETHEKLKQQAKQQGRTMAGHIRYLLDANEWQDAVMHTKVIDGVSDGRVRVWGQGVSG